MEMSGDQTKTKIKDPRPKPKDCYSIADCFIHTGLYLVARLETVETVTRFLSFVPDTGLKPRCE